ncbi:PAS domain S-box protein [Polaromonas sp. YR568]|uniref:PAS domain S-box protein n=1 Tax=Polaromonas sp. YR568 TaxID=1855301 RepID=UPI00398BE98D
MNRDETLIQAVERSEAQALELTGLKLALQASEDNAQRLRSLAAISADWYWEQDCDHRFTGFYTEQDTGKLDAAVLESAVGRYRWDLSGITPLGMSWDEHRAVLDARQPFRDFEYMRELEGQSLRYFSISGVPLFDGNGRFIGYRGTTRDISESKRAEQVQRRAFRILDDIVDSIPIAFHLKSVRDGRHEVILWNKAAEALYGVSSREALGRTVHELWPKADADRIHAADLELIEQGVMQDFPDCIALTRHRGAIHVHMRKVPLKDDRGVVTHILVVAEDMTANQAAAARLRHSEMRFRSLTQLSSDWYWELDEEFRFTLLSGGAGGEIKTTVAGSLGKTRWEISDHPANDAAWIAHRSQLERHETFRGFEFECENPGGLRILSISGEPVVDAGGKFTGYRGVGTDITARKEAETALRTSEARFRAVVAVLAEAILVRDAEGKIIDCNASAEYMFGKTLDQLKGMISVAADWQTLNEDGSIILERDRPAALARRTGLAQSNAIMHCLKPDGSVFWGSTNVRPLFDGISSTPYGFVSSISDIGERKRAELEILRLNADLENQVQRRTLQLEAANKELEAFSYSVAHDLRSPLGTIDGYCALLQKLDRPNTGDRVHHYLDRIRSGVRQMVELTDGLLSLTQLSRANVNWETVDLSADANSILARCLEKDPARIVHVTVEPGLLVQGDRALLRQVLENLIANAWKFSSRKTDAEIHVGKELDVDLQAIYFVRDNGAGFDMARADKLFSVFQRQHSSEDFPGSGIGLATVNRIIARHGGKIWAHSAVGQGSTFYFTLGAA